jgi:hypothetical protein
VFAVDTTGSMGGLIDGAKRTVWSIANHIRKTDEHASLRIGLVAYRDVGDDYITKDFALTSDLDAVFADCRAFRPTAVAMSRERRRRTRCHAAQDALAHRCEEARVPRR